MRKEERIIELLEKIHNETLDVTEKLIASRKIKFNFQDFLYYTLFSKRNYNYTDHSTVALILQLAKLEQRIEELENK